MNEEVQLLHRVGREFPQHPSSYFGEMKTLGSFQLNMQFQYTHTKEVKSQDLLCADLRSRGEGSPPYQVTIEQETESRVASTVA